jgi:hypothetical protein
MSRLLKYSVVWLNILGTVAIAAEKPRILVLPFGPAADGRALKFQELVVEELKTREDTVEVVAVPGASPPAAIAAVPEKPLDKPVAPSKASAHLADARKAYDELRFDAASALFNKGIAAAQADPANAPFDEVIDAYVKLAAASFRRAEEREAKKALTELARLSPRYELAPGFPPVFQLEFAKANKRLEKVPKARVTIAGPPGATVSFDGRDLGMLPVTEESVAAGTHYLRVVGSKGELFGKVVEVAGTEVAVEAQFSAAQVAIASKSPGATRGPTKAGGTAMPVIAGTLDASMAASLADYARAQRADYLLMGYVTVANDTQLTAASALYSAKAKGWTGLTPLTIDRDVLMAATEAFKLVEEVFRKEKDFGTQATLPLVLGVEPKVDAPVAAAPSAASTVEKVSSRRVLAVPKEDSASAPEVLTPISVIAAAPPAVEPAAPVVAAQKPTTTSQKAATEKPSSAKPPVEKAVAEKVGKAASKKKAGAAKVEFAQGEAPKAETGRKVVLLPAEEPPAGRVIAPLAGSAAPPSRSDELDGTMKKGVPKWVWFAVGGVVLAGAGVGGYFGYQAATRPVTGTATATW